MRNLIFTIFIAFTTFSVFAQTSSPQSKEILDKTYNIYTQSKGVGFDFNVKTSNGKSTSSQKGNVMAKGNKFRVTMPGMSTWFDGKTQWVLLRDNNEVNVSTPSQAEIASISPIALMSMYKSGYNLKNPVSKIVSRKAAWSIELTPVKKGDFSKIIVAVDKKSYQLLQINGYQQNGVTNTINVVSYNDKNNFDDAIFSFSKRNYPNVEVIDLRE